MICIGSPEARIMGACKLYSVGAGIQAKARLGEKEALLTLRRHFSPSSSGRVLMVHILTVVVS